MPVAVGVYRCKARAIASHPVAELVALEHGRNHDTNAGGAAAGDWAARAGWLR